MPFSESLAARIRDRLFGRRDIAEQKMFGGPRSRSRNILVGVRRDSRPIARLGEEETLKVSKGKKNRIDIDVPQAAGPFILYHEDK